MGHIIHSSMILKMLAELNLMGTELINHKRMECHKTVTNLTIFIQLTIHSCPLNFSASVIQLRLMSSLTPALSCCMGLREVLLFLPPVETPKKQKEIICFLLFLSDHPQCLGL